MTHPTLPVAKSAYFEGISFRPEGWALRENEALKERAASIVARAADLIKIRGAQMIAPEMVESLISRHAKLTAAYWSAMSRCLNPMITGPARFPVEREWVDEDPGNNRHYLDTFSPTGG